MARGVGWRTLVIPVAALVVAGLVAGCGGSDETTAADGPPKIAFLLPDEQAVRYRDRSGFEEKVGELCGRCKILYSNARGGVAAQQSQAERALTESADVLVVDPVEPGAASRIVRKANAKDVPVLSYARLILNSPVDYYVGVNSEGLGELQAEVLRTGLEDEAKSKGPIVMVTIGSDGLQDAGARATFDSAGVRIAKAYEIDGSTPGSAAFPSARREMQRAIDALGAKGFAAVLTSDDETAAGAIAAMKSAGIDPRQKPTTGAGATLSAVKRVLAGQQYMSVYEGTLEQGPAGARMAVSLATGEGVPASWITGTQANGVRDVPAILLPSTAVTGENLMSTVIPYGFIKPAELCVGAYAKHCAEAGIPTG